MPLRTRTFSLVSAALACAFFASACNGSDQVVEPLAAYAGQYTLTTANGQLPLRFFHSTGTGQSTIDLTGGTLLLTNSGSFGEVLNYHVVPPSPDAPFDAPAQATGTYRVDGANITFTYTANGTPYSWGGTVGTGTVTYNDPAFTDIVGGLTAVYTKQ